MPLNTRFNGLLRSFMGTRKTKSLLVVLLVLGIIGFGVVHRAFATTADCEPEKIYQRVTSPDGHWEAVVAEHVCEGGFAFTTVALYVVELVSKTNAADRHVIFSSDDAGYEDYIPAVTWLNQKSLQVTIKQSPLIGRQDAKSSGIDISYKTKN